MKKSLLILASVILPLSGCQKTPDKPKEITFQHYFSGSLSGGIDELVQAFNKQNQGIRLIAKPVDHETYKTTFQETLRSPHPPEFLSYWAGAKTAAVSSELADLTDIWDKSGLRDSFSLEVTASAATVKGKRVLIPLTQHYVGFFYNKRVFSKLKLTEPKTYDEFLQICQTLKSAGITPIALGSKALWPAQFWFDYLLLRTAGYGFREELMNRTQAYTDPRVKKVMALWKGLLDQGYISANPTEKDWDNDAAVSVLKGEAGMTLMGTWLIGFYEAAEQQSLGGQYDFFSFPVIDPRIPLSALGPIDGAVIPGTVQDWKEMKTVIQYLAAPDVQMAMSQGSGALAPNLKVPDTFYTPLQNKIRRDIALAQSWSFNYDLATDPAVSQLGLTFFKKFLLFPDRADQLLEYLENQVQEVIKGL